MHGAFATCTLALATLIGVAGAQGRADEALRREFESKKLALRIESGQRHLELGLECREKGLAQQAAEQITLAVEVSEHQNTGANTVLGLMRRYDDKFWLKRAPKPTAARREAYAKKAHEVERENLGAWLDFAAWADKRGLDDGARAEYVAFLRRRDEPLEFDAKGALDVGVGKIPPAAAALIRAAAIEINGRLYVRDEFLERMPELTVLFETASPQLRVRSTLDVELTRRVHALALALLPLLAEDLGAAPQRRLNVVVLRDRATYERYLDVAGLGSHKIVTGVADSGTFTAVIDAEDLDATTLDGVVLHELTHLFHYGVSPSVMPSWYAEGLADTYGGPGTFEWKDGRLSAGGMLASARLELLRASAPPFTIAELLAGDALSMWSAGRDRGFAFYAQAWAWVRFLRHEAGAAIAERFARWETMCRGALVGAEIGKPRGGSRADADTLFKREFGADLLQLERDFRRWASEL